MSSKTTAVKNADGTYGTVPTAQVASTSNLGGLFDTNELAVNANPEDYSDSFELPMAPGFTFRIRVVSDRIREKDAEWPLATAKELGLVDKARAQLEREKAEVIDDETVNERALELMNREVFRYSPKLSARYDQLLKERHLAVIVGNPESDDPADWGGLVKWFSNALPYSVKHARAANILLRVQLYGRIMGLSSYGVNDATFRGQGH